MVDVQVQVVRPIIPAWEEVPNKTTNVEDGSSPQPRDLGVNPWGSGTSQSRLVRTLHSLALFYSPLEAYKIMMPIASEYVSCTLIPPATVVFSLIFACPLG